MTRVHILYIILIGILLNACQIAGGEEDVDVQLGAGNGFNNDWVAVEIDGRGFLADTLISNEFENPHICCYPAAAKTITIPAARHQVHVTVNERVRELVFDARKYRSLWISYIPEEEEIRVDFYEERLLHW